MKRIVVTTVFAAVAAASGAAQTAAAVASSTVRPEPLSAPSYQIVVQARMVGTFDEISGLDPAR